MTKQPPSSTSNLLLYLLAIFLPPVAVFLKRGLHADFVINVVFTIIGWIPGVIHAWFVVGRYERSGFGGVYQAPVTTTTTTTAPLAPTTMMDTGGTGAVGGSVVRDGVNGTGAASAGAGVGVGVPGAGVGTGTETGAHTGMVSGVEPVAAPPPPAQGGKI